MATLLVLAIGVVGPVQASVHAMIMSSQLMMAVDVLADDANTAAISQHLHHSSASHNQHHASHSADNHLTTDSLCLELCLLTTLVPGTNGALFYLPLALSAQPAIVGAPLRSGEPVTPPPKALF